MQKRQKITGAPAFAGTPDVRWLAHDLLDALPIGQDMALIVDLDP